MDDQLRKTLNVPGARISYQVRGSGPVLLLIPAGPSDSGMFADVAPLLAERYTVVTYDPRGLSESTLDDPAKDITVETQADDAHRLLHAVTDEPAYVFGFCGGSTTALSLTAAHPEQVRALVVHEPPIVELVPDFDEHRAHYTAIYEIAHTVGITAAMERFIPYSGVDVQEELDAEARAARDAMLRNMEDFVSSANLQVFFGPMWRPLAGYLPDIDKLRVTPAPVVIGIGTTTEGQFPYRASVRLAELLGTQPAVFPGDHHAMLKMPWEFSERLLEVFSALVDATQETPTSGANS